MYKYKPVRYIFRLLNLIIYAAVISFSVIAIRDDLCITDFMTQIIVFLILFAVYDYLMRWQIMFRLDVSYFRVKDKL